MEKFNQTVTLLRISHIITCVMYLCSLVVLAFFTYAVATVPAGRRGFDTDDKNITLMILGFCVLLLAFSLFVYVLGSILAGKRSKGNWIFQLVLAALGISGLITAIPYLYSIMKLTDPEVKKYFENKNL